MSDLVHHREYPMGWAGDVLDAATTVIWPVVTGAFLGCVLFIFGFAVLETDESIPAVLDASMRGWFGAAILASLALLLLAFMVSALRTLHYAGILARWRETPGTQYEPPTPTQRSVARGIVAGNTTKPFVGLWISALVLMLLGSFVAVFALIDLDRDGSPGMFIGGLIAAVSGFALNRFVALIRRTHASRHIAWRHDPADQGTPDQDAVLIDLPAPLIVRAERVVRSLGKVAVFTFAGAAAIGLGPAASSRALLPWVIASDREIAAPLMTIIFSASLAMVFLLAVSMGLGAARRGLLLRALEDEAAKASVGRDQIPTTRPSSELTMEALGNRGSFQRAEQLLAAAGALLITLAVPALEALALRYSRGLPNGIELLNILGAAAIGVAFIAALMTARRDRDRRNRLLRTWPRALSPGDVGRLVS